MSEQHEPGADQRDGRDEPLSTADLAGARTPAADLDAETEQDADDVTRSTPAEEPRSFAAGADDAEAAAPVFPSQEADGLRQQWDTIQASFVDEPRRAVEDADHLVAATMQRLAESFAEERAKLEAQWGRGDDVSTEDLRVALRRYRSFFGRLLSA
jgi:hypothetical protein